MSLLKLISFASRRVLTDVAVRPQRTAGFQAAASLRAAGGFIGLQGSTNSIRTMFTTNKNEGGVKLNGTNMNQNVVKLQYDVRGPIVTRAGEIEEELQKVFIFNFI